MNTFGVYTTFGIEIEKGLDSWLWDTDGIRYLDMYGGHAVISVGHTHPDYVRALTKQLEKIGFYSNAVKIGLQETLAQKLGELSGYEDYSLFLCSSGAEANENAFKLASFQTGRKKIVAFRGGFHGRTSLAVAATDNEAITAPVNENEDVLLLPFNQIDGLEDAIDESTCAVIVEGIQGVGGVRLPSEEFLNRISELCREKGAMLILDEVQSGYGRSGKFFAHQHAGIRPDLITVAKGMGNGFPVAGVLIGPQFEAKKEMLGTTFGGNYLACTAALAVLEIIEREKLVANASKMGEKLIEGLKDVPGVKEVRGTGLMIGIELEFPAAGARNELLYEHRIFTGSSSCKNTIRLLPSLAIGEAGIDHFLETFSTVMNAIHLKEAL
jgi:acetylornithine/N-succinyldiaminopimelate aminotransferase